MSAADWKIQMQAECRARLLAALAGAPVPEVAWEGEAYSPTPSIAYIAEAFRMQSERAVSVGRGKTIEHRADFALTLHYPGGAGTLPSDTMAKSIVGAFAPGQPLERGGCSGWVSSSTRRGSIQTPDRISVPVIVAVLGYSHP